MSAVRTETIVGAAVVAAAVGFLLYSAQFANVSREAGGYGLTASFRSVEGVSVGTDVRLAGVKIGTVTDITLDPQTFRALTTLSVAQGIALPDDSAVVISSEGLLGGNFVEILPGGSPFNFEAGDEIEDTQSSVSLISLLLKFVSGSGDE
ncbi:outer membrane lipid asymmetry maintenance protein MlaD [Shimia sp. R11_0]|uniref:Putative phospholipid ABC transporter-binding protein MlaD n=1 Tax=Shimia marina TaxID=321267 RepID=A0A0P1ERI4_9RHOB|nr:MULTISPECIES: outer membrane lipid asymmetry maintenance protein MlaD [Shimia]MBO9477363.1 outer membrane lipid asymmetry maintenance protein MlaD [Shimia sp. R11_0]CUH52842.1 putative phospholipid ABC transporter-binding protein MlaD [Shimia marina]SFD88699.1 phospholipid/cholesterol/gamma-HCH transport system substrate-binding protein [Shimia marina]